MKHETIKPKASRHRAAARKTGVANNRNRKKVLIHNDLSGNGLAQGIFGGNAFGFNPGTGFTQTISQADTQFLNLRWYFISNFRQFLSELFVESGLVQTICTLPVDDGLRGGVTIISKQLDPEQIEMLEAIMDRESDLMIVAEALYWNRLFGGAGILTLTDQDPYTPLDESLIDQDTPLSFRAVDMWELFWDKQNTEGFDFETQTENFEHYDYYGINVHKSRVMKLIGRVAPSFLRPRLRGWGFSEIESLIRGLNSYTKTTDVAFEIMDEFKVDVFKIQDFNQALMDPQGQQQIQQRIQLANMQKNYQNALSMDTQDDYQQKQVSFAGIADIQKENRNQVSSDIRIPQTKLFGQSSAGFNSGEDDIENYNMLIEGQVRSKCKYEIIRMIELRCQKEFGFIPDDLKIEFKPLRILSAEQEEQVKTQQYTRIHQAREAGFMSPEKYNEAVNGENLLGVQLTDEDITDANTAELLPGENVDGAPKVEDEESFSYPEDDAPLKGASTKGGAK